MILSNKTSKVLLSMERCQYIFESSLKTLEFGEN